MRFLSCFSGIGGIDCGLEWAGWTCVGQIETDPYCRNILQRHWPHVPKRGDIRLVDGETVRAMYGRVDAIVGGVPCQPVSVAGKRQGSADSRWLWPDFLRLVREVAPRYVLAENVPGLVGLQPHGADWVLDELEAAGYETMPPIIVGARHVGAPHRRDRVWIVARLTASRRGRAEAVAHGHGAGCSGEWIGGISEVVDPQCRDDVVRRHPWPARPGEPQHDWEAPRTTQSGVGHAVNGIPGRVAGRKYREALKALGSAVVPAVAEQIGRAILAVEQAQVAA